VRCCGRVGRVHCRAAQARPPRAPC
jgi:hypothetical protein